MKLEDENTEGYFVTFEGIDGAGKTSAIDAFEEEYDIIRTAEPSEEWTGKQVRRALQEQTPEFTDFFLFMADRHMHIEDLIKPGVVNGEIVVSDRFSDSTLAYQTVQLGPELQFPLQWIEEVMNPWNIQPDLTIYIDISVDTALERADEDEKYEKREMLESVKSNYEDLARRYSRFERVDGEQDKEDVIEDCKEVFEQHVPDRLLTDDNARFL